MPFKILYATSNRPGAKFQLHRFLDHIKPYDFQIKLAGFRSMNMHLDWCLDALQDMFDPSRINLNNDNLEIYAEQIKAYNPHLIISDLEIYTSYIGEQFDLNVWNVSPLLMLHPNVIDETPTIVYKYQIPITNSIPKDIYKFIITNANQNFIYSPFCDMPKPPSLIEGYSWIRPYYYSGNISEVCRHNYVIASHKENKKLAKIEDNDLVLFADPTRRIKKTKNIFDTDEYGCNIKNAKCCINQGITDLLSDTLYNNKSPIIIPDMLDPEVAMNVALLEHYNLGYIAFDGNIEGIEQKEINMLPNENVRFLHEEIEALIY